MFLKLITDSEQFSSFSATVFLILFNPISKGIVLFIECLCVLTQ